MFINEYINAAYENAVNHGWHEKKRSGAEVAVLLISELSEALEEYRNRKPMHYFNCASKKKLCTPYYVGDEKPVCKKQSEWENCQSRNKKPEGVAVELIDYIIRVLDYAGEIGAKVKNDTDTFVDALEAIPDVVKTQLQTISFPTFVFVLEKQTLDAFANDGDDAFTFEGLLRASFMIMYWIEIHGFDPIALLEEKHEHNVSRPYRHGDKTC